MTTRSQWATALLDYAGWSPSTEKIDALVAQASKENTGAVNNPIATTEPAPGATDYNSAGVKNYPSYDGGLAATLATLRNGDYPQLVRVLSDPAGGSAVAYCTSVELNTWGTGNCLTELESIRSGDPNGYLSHQIVGGGNPLPEPSPPTPPPPSGITFGPPFGDDMQAVPFSVTLNAQGRFDAAVALPAGTIKVVDASVDFLSLYGTTPPSWDPVIGEAGAAPAVGANPALQAGFGEIVVWGPPGKFLTGHAICA